MTRAIEDGFPIRAVSQLAERESWRKEIYRPIYYVHKWWARRLGSVFRAIILSCCAEEDEDIESLFYQPVRFPGIVVFDPFVDLVITDPPFFDNVHYSQLADFFYSWLRVILDEHEDFVRASTRSVDEVQDTDAESFTCKLASVFRECHRVLADSGLLAMTYHHSRIEGWTSVYTAIREGGFYITHTQPVRAEMAVSVPIQQSKSPVHFDLILVCRKSRSGVSASEADGVSLRDCITETKAAVLDLRGGDIKVSVGDVKVMLMGSILSRLAALDDLAEEVSTICESESQVDALAERILVETDLPTPSFTLDNLQRGGLYPSRDVAVYEQLRLLLEELEEYAA